MAPISRAPSRPLASNSSSSHKMALATLGVFVLAVGTQFYPACHGATLDDARESLGLHPQLVDKVSFVSRLNKRHENELTDVTDLERFLCAGGGIDCNRLALLGALTDGILIDHADNPLRVADMSRYGQASQAHNQGIRGQPDPLSLVEMMIAQKQQQLMRLPNRDLASSLFEIKLSEFPLRTSKRGSRFIPRIGRR